jgi:hypothetical protein
MPNLFVLSHPKLCYNVSMNKNQKALWKYPPQCWWPELPGKSTRTSDSLYGKAAFPTDTVATKPDPNWKYVTQSIGGPVLNRNNALLVARAEKRTLRATRRFFKRNGSGQHRPQK